MGVRVGLSLRLAQTLTHKIIIMKRGIYSILFLLCCACEAWGQGSVNWLTINFGFMTAQTNSTQYSPFIGGGSTGSGTIGAAGGSANPGPNFRFQLLYGPEFNGSIISPPTTLSQLNSWSDSGLSATNALTVAGRLVPVAGSSHATTPIGWDAGHTNYIIMVGWSANLGATWSEAKANLNNGFLGVSYPAYFGVSSVGYIRPSTLNQDPGVSVFGQSSTANGQPIYSLNTQLYLTGDLLLWYDNAQLPVITQHPQNQTVNAGSSASFSVAATNNPPFFYQWYKNGLVITNATNSTLVINPATPSDAGNYSVWVRNIVGYRSVVSSNATLTVNMTYPVITTQPASQTTLSAGSALSLNVQATNNPPFAYQWYLNNAALLDQTNATLAYNPTYTNDSGSYRVMVSNSFGSVNSSNAIVFVYQPAFIVTPPANQLASYGNPASFSVAADGFPTPTNFQWSFNGSPIVGANTSTLLIPSVTTNKLGSYSIIVSNAYGSAQSSATLTMLPSLVTPFAGISGLWGQPGTLSVVAAGSGTLAYQWYKDGVAISGANGSTYYLSSLQLTNSGSYYVVVSSAYGSVTNAVAPVEVRPSDTIFGVYAGITVQGSVGNSYSIQYSTDLVSWTTATNIVLDQPSANWSDYSADFRNNSGKYYRVIPTP